MFIVWGTKRVEKKLGWVSDYCPVCDDAHVHRLMEVRMVEHIYYIPLGRGKSAGYVKQCMHCNNKFTTAPQQYAHISKKKLASREELTDVTNPSLIERMAKLLDLREQAVHGQVSEDERRDLLFHAFCSIASPVAKRKEQINLDWLSSLCLIAMVMVPIVIYFICTNVSVLWMNDDLAVKISIGIFIILLFAFVMCVFGDTSRFIRSRFKSEVIKRLSPLNPDVEELREVLQRLKADPDTKAIGKAFNADTLHHAIKFYRENNMPVK